MIFNIYGDVKYSHLASELVPSKVNGKIPIDSRNTEM